MEKEMIYREDVLNMNLTLQVVGEHDARVVQQTLEAVLQYVRKIPPAEPEKKPVTRRKKA